MLLSSFDIFVLLAIVASLMIGFALGLLKQFVGLASIYIGLVLATQYYYFLGDFLRRFSVTSERLLNALSFFFILLLVALIVNWLVHDTLGTNKGKPSGSRNQAVALIDHLGGMVLGLCTVIVVLTILLPILQFTTMDPWPAGWTENLRSAIAQSIITSEFKESLNNFKPLLFDSIKPWLPGRSLPSMFTL